MAVGILQLIEQGKIKFEDTLGTLLDIDLHNIDGDVTVEQLFDQYLKAHIFDVCGMSEDGYFG